LTRRLADLVHHKWVLEGLQTCLRVARGSSIAHVLEAVMVDAPLPLLAVSILASLSAAIVPEKMTSQVDQLKRQLERYASENGQLEETFPFRSSRSEAPATFSSEGQWSASIEDGSCRLWERTMPTYSQESHQNNKVPESHHWPSPQTYEFGPHELDGLSTEFEASIYSSEVGLVQILQWLKGLPSPSGTNGSESSLGLSRASLQP